MSTTVDNRVVEMQFDNKQFEANVKTTMSTLEKLKQSLNFRGASKGLESVQSAASKCDLSGLTKGVETAQNSFSALQVMGVTALATITNQAVVAGQRMVKALTVAPVTDGFREYETQMNAVQTILANTQKEGTNVAIVNRYLDELNEYADKTIYNFTEMTRNIGTFTAAGVKLDTSVSAIKGIANLAATSGSTSQQASTAMYQLSQAIASGTVRLMDWNSVVNAGMGGQVFQDALIRTSELLGTGAEAAIEAQGSFRESLRDGWLTTEVLTQTLDQFATAADTEEEYAAAVKKFVEQGYTEEQARQIADMAKTAGEAATKVKTFTQLIDTCKESLGSGWAQTWRIIIGDFEEARVLWTSVGDVLTGLINNFSEARNTLLESALGQTFTGLAEKVTGVLDPALDMADAVTDVTESVADLGAVIDDVILGKFGNGQERFDALTEAGQNYYRIQNEVNKKLGESYRYTEEQIAAQDELLGIQEQSAEATGDAAKGTKKLTDAQKKQLKVLGTMSDEMLAANGFTEEQIAALNELRDVAEKLNMPFDEFIDRLDEINGRWILIESIKNIGRAIYDVFSAIGTAFSNVFDAIQPQQVFDLITNFHGLTAALIPSQETLDKLTRAFTGLFSAIQLVTTIAGGVFKVAFAVLSRLLESAGLTVLDLVAIVGDMVTKFNDWFQDSIFIEVVEKIVEGIEKVIDVVKDFVNQFQIDEKLAAGWESLANGVSSLWTIVKASLPKVAWPTLINNVLKLFGTTTGDALLAISDFIVKIFDWLDANTLLIKGTAKIAEIVKTLIEGIVDLYESFMALEPVQEFIQGIADAFENFFGALGGIKIGTGAFDTLLSTIETVFTRINDWLSTLGDSEHFGRDLVTGLFNGIVSGIGMVVSGVVALATSIIETICGILGIQSPSTVMFEIGQNVIQGLVNGLSAGLSWLWGLLSGIGSGIINAGSTLRDAGYNFFTGLWNGLTAGWSGLKSFLSGVADGFLEIIDQIDWGVVAVAATAAAAFFLMFSLIKVFDKFASAAETLASPFKSFGKGIENIGGALKDYVKVQQLRVKADALKSLALAIGIVAASIWLLSKIDIGAAWNAVAIVAVITGLLAGLMVALTKFATIDVNGVKQLIDIGKIAVLFISMGASLVLLAAAMKLIASLGWEDVGKAGAAIAGFGVIVGALVWVTKFAGNSVQMAMTAKIISKLAISLLLIAALGKLISTMTWPDLGKAGAAIAGFGIFIVALMAATKLIDKGNFDDVGDNILKIAAAIGIMALVVKLISTMEQSDIDRGREVITGFGILIVGLMAATELLTKKNKNFAKLGTLLLGAAAAIGILAVVARLIANMPWQSLGKAAIALAAFGAIIVLFMAMTKYTSGGKKLKGVATTLLAMSAAVALLGGICVLFGLVDPAILKKGAQAMAGLALIVVMMTLATGYAKNLTHTMKGIAICIGILAASVAILSFIEPSRLIAPTIALGILMGMFSLVIASTGKVKKALSTLIVLSVAIGVLTAALAILSVLNVESTIENAIALSILMAALSIGLQAMSKISRITKSAMKGAAVLAASLIVLSVALKILDGVDCVGSIGNAVALSILVGALSIAMLALNKSKAAIAKAIPGILAMSAAVVIMSFALRILNGVDFGSAIGNAIALGILVMALAGAMLLMGSVTKAAITGAGAMVIMSVGLIAIAAALYMLKDIPFEQIMSGVAGLCIVIFALAGAAAILGLFAAGATALCGVLAVASIFVLAVSAAFLIFSGALYIVGVALPMVGDGMTALGVGIENFVTSVANCSESIGDFAGVISTIGNSILGCLSSVSLGMVIAAMGATVLAPAAVLLGGGLVVAAVGMAAAALGATLLAAGIVLLGGAVALSVYMIVSAMTGLGEFAQTAGGDLVAGFANGIMGGLELLAAAGFGFVGTITSTICGLLGIQSPSTVAMGWGQNTGEGYAIGLENSTPGAESAASSFVNAIKGIFSGDTSFEESMGNKGSEGAASFDAGLTEGMSGIDISSILSESGLDMSQFETMMNTEGTEGAASFGTGFSEGMAGLDLSSMLSGTGFDTSQFQALMNTEGSNSATSFLDGFNANSGDFTAASTGMMDAFNQGITDSTASSTAAMETLIQALIDTINNSSAKFAAAMTTVINSAASAASSTSYMKFYSAGYNCAIGFANGISSGSFAATMRARAMANAAAQAAKDALDINSPSRVFMKIGQGVPEGFAKGIDKYGYYVTNSIDTMATNALENTKSVISRVGDALAYADMDSQPTIRPVVDLSNVESGAAAINGLFGSMTPSMAVAGNINAISTSMRRNRQNGVNSDVVSAIGDLRKDLHNIEKPSYSIGDVTYSPGTEVADAIETLVNAVRVEGRA